MSTITIEKMVDFLRELRERELNTQAVISSKSENLLYYYQDRIDHLNAIIEILKTNEFNDYQQLAMRTANNLTQEQMVLNGVLGLSGETGEIADLVKKATFQGHMLNHRKMVEEAGDTLWYLALLAQGLGVTLGQLAEYNIAKLQRRYPYGFDPERSINRESEKE